MWKLLGFCAIAVACVAETEEDARKELYAARYTKAAELYRRALQDSPTNGDNYYGLVRSLINDGPNRLFLIDSGSSQNLIDSEVAAEATKVHRDYQTRLRGVQGSVEKVSRADNVSLTFAGFRQENPDLLAISLEKMSDSFGVGFAGVIGWPVLGQMRLTIDYRNGAVRFVRAVK